MNADEVNSDEPYSVWVKSTFLYKTYISMTMVDESTN